MQSLKNTKNAIDIALDTLKYTYDLLAFPETCFTSCENAVPFKGCNCVTFCRVAIYIHDSTELDVIEEYTIVTSDLESVMMRSANLFLAVIKIDIRLYSQDPA